MVIKLLVVLVVMHNKHPVVADLIQLENYCLRKRIKLKVLKIRMFFHNSAHDTYMIGKQFLHCYQLQFIQLCNKL